jgi:hypothetical protein
MTKKDGLPPITDIVIPDGIKSTRIRWLSAMGYEVKEISAFLGIRYQQVRNVITNTPKRAAREDMPPLVLVYKEEQDLFEAAMDGTLDESLLAARAERKAAEKAQRRADREAGAGQDEEQDEEQDE